MRDDYLTRKIRKLVKLFRRSRKQGFSPQTLLRAGDFKEAQDLGREILDCLLWNPGSLVSLRNFREMKEAEQAIEILWEYWDPDKVFIELLEGEFGGLFGYLADRYADRARFLRPTFTLLRPKSEVRMYLNQAMQAWAHGLDISSVILCWSVIENLLREKLSENGSQLSSDRGKWIRTARERGWLETETSRSADRIRTLRNEMVHKPRKFAPRRVYAVIMETKEVVERLLQ
jgi:hypothetical protein